MTDAAKGTVYWLAWQAQHAREQGQMVVLTPDEADAVVANAARISVGTEKLVPPPLEDTGDVT